MKDVAAYRDLNAIVDRIRAIAGDQGLISRAQRLPDVRAGEAHSLSVVERYGHSCPPGLRDYAASVLNEVAARRRTEAEQERDQLLAAYAGEIEGLRIELTRHAGKLAVELGVLARSIRP